MQQHVRGTTPSAVHAINIEARDEGGVLAAGS